MIWSTRFEYVSLFEVCSCIVKVFYNVPCVAVLIVSGEGYGFVQFARLYPHVLVKLLVFSLCSSVGQVCVCMSSVLLSP